MLHALDEVAARTPLRFVWHTRADVSRRLATHAVLERLPSGLQEAAMVLEALG